MHTRDLSGWQHDHSFGQGAKRPGESRTLLVVALTAVTMVVEIVAGLAFGSMALLADGLHMASHAVALSITFVAYVYARKHAENRGFSFGAGKVNALGGFTGAVLLALFALWMAGESFTRFLEPIDIAFDQAMIVAAVGLVVNGVSVVLLGHKHEEAPQDPGHGHGHEHHHHHDHNLRSAYLHVLADALTSLLAIFALLGGKYFGAMWMDPAMGVVGAVLVARWSVGLLRDTSAVLLDRQAPDHLALPIREALEAGSNCRVADLHLWSVGPGIYSVIVSIVTSSPRAPEHYKELMPRHVRIVHHTIEVHRCEGPEPGDE